MHAELGRRKVIAGIAALSAGTSPAVRSAAAQTASPIRLPILVPLTGPLSIEGTSQRNGALLAARALAGRVDLRTDVVDTAQSAEQAVTAWHRAMREGTPPAVVAPIFGPQMMALMPLAADRQVPILTISGTAHLSDAANPWFFRFFPSDAVAKIAQARFVVEKLGSKRPAVLYQTTAYGQSGREHLARAFGALGVKPVHEEGVTLATTDLSTVVGKALGAGADALVLQLHAEWTAKAVERARVIAPAVPIVAGSAMHQPVTARLLPVETLRGVCAETAASPISAATPDDKAFLDAYRAQYGEDPDAFALTQYDAVMALGAVVEALRRDGAPVEPERVRGLLAEREHTGIATKYRSDGRGNMNHEVVLVCYDGTSRVPKIEQKYNFRQ